MRRRDLLLVPWWMQAVFSQNNPSQTGNAAPQENKPREWVTTTASRDTAPRVGLIPSFFKGGEEMDGRKIRPLSQPAPLTAALSAGQLEDMLRLAVELGGGRRGGLATAIGSDDWVVVKVSMAQCPGSAGFHAGTVTDPRLAGALLRYLAARRLGKRFSIVEALPCQPGAGAASLWDSTWEGKFDGVSYRSLVNSLSKQYPALRLELIDLHRVPALQMPVEGRVFSKQNPDGLYRIPRILRECDKVISIAPLATMAGPGVALSLINYLSFFLDGRQTPAAGRLTEASEMAVDLFSFHPAEYAIVGGSLAAEADGPASLQTRMRRYNVVIAGTNAPAVDAVAAAVMGFDSTTIRHLELAVQRGYGLNDAYSIWTRGAEIDEVKAEFQRP